MKYCFNLFNKWICSVRLWHDLYCFQAWTRSHHTKDLTMLNLFTQMLTMESFFCSNDYIHVMQSNRHTFRTVSICIKCNSFVLLWHALYWYTESTMWILFTLISTLESDDRNTSQTVSYCTKCFCFVRLWHGSYCYKLWIYLEQKLQ